MLCPFCKTVETQVKDSRLDTTTNIVKRRRYCPRCNMRFNTEEIISLKGLKVQKNNNKTEEFERSKLVYSINKALGKNSPIIDQAEKIAANIIDKLTVRKIQVVSSVELGELILMELKPLDKVAYLRFLTVHRRIESLSAIKGIIDELENTTVDKAQLTLFPSDTDED